MNEKIVEKASKQDRFSEKVKIVGEGTIYCDESQKNFRKNRQEKRCLLKTERR